MSDPGSLEESMWWILVGNAGKVGILLKPQEDFGEGRGLKEWQREVTSA